MAIVNGAIHFQRKRAPGGGGPQPGLLLCSNQPVIRRHHRCKMAAVAAADSHAEYQLKLTRDVPVASAMAAAQGNGIPVTLIWRGRSDPTYFPTTRFPLPL